MKRVLYVITLLFCVLLFSCSNRQDEGRKGMLASEKQPSTNDDTSNEEVSEELNAKLSDYEFIDESSDPKEETSSSADLDGDAPVSRSTKPSTTQVPQERKVNRNPKASTPKPIASNETPSPKVKSTPKKDTHSATENPEKTVNQYPTSKPTTTVPKPTTSGPSYSNPPRSTYTNTYTSTTSSTTTPDAKPLKEESKPSSTFPNPFEPRPVGEVAPDPAIAGVGLKEGAAITTDVGAVSVVSSDGIPDEPIKDGSLVFDDNNDAIVTPGGLMFDANDVLQAHPLPSAGLNAFVSHKIKDYDNERNEIITDNLDDARPADLNVGENQDIETTAGATYLSTDEVDMVREINLLRSNPKGYTKYINAYMNELSEKGFDEFVKEGFELSSMLKTMEPLPVLKPHPALYEATRKHGAEQKHTGKIDYVGQNGSFPWDRILSESPEFEDGSENMIGDETSIRKAVILLLIDGRIEDKGHRKNLLSPHWDYVVCHQIGQVGETSNVWIQSFAKRKSPKKEDVEFTTRLDGPDGEYLNTAKDAYYMTERERDMIKEINMARAHPQEYVGYLEDYIEEAKTWESPSKMEGLYDLIAEFKTAESVSLIQPDAGLYQQAKDHGLYQKRIGYATHTGGDGSDPWDRAKRVPGITYGKECIAGGPDLVRRTVIILLIDAGIPSRAHRRTILDPTWEKAACYETGLVGDMPFSWVQLFGRTQEPPEKPIYVPPTKATPPTAKPPVVPEKPVVPSTPPVVEKKEEPAPIQSPIKVTSVPPVKEVTPVPPAVTSKPPVEKEVTFTTPVISTPKEETVAETPTKAPTYTPEEVATPEVLNTGSEANYLSAIEKEMIREINYVRAFPEEYIKHIDEYKKELQRQGKIKEYKAALELISELRAANSLSLLYPEEALYQAAQKHGIDQQKRGYTGHVGSDGTLPLGRIKASSDYTHGAENLVGDAKSVREAVILLLIDAGITNRAHRKAILNPEWKYIGCYYAGKVGYQSNCWVQNFATK